MKKHKCAECGYLAQRDNETRQLEEVERNEEGNFVFPQIVQAYDAGWRSALPKYNWPICLATASNLVNEYANESVDTGPDNTWETRVKLVLSRPRDCEAFTEWIQGFTPKEHRETMDRERMRKQDHQWHKDELILIIFGNIFVGIIVAFFSVILTYWITSRGN